MKNRDEHKEKIRVVIGFVFGFLILAGILAYYIAVQKGFFRNPFVTEERCIVEMKIDEDVIEQNAELREETFSDFENVSAIYLEEKKLIGVHKDTDFTRRKPREVVLLLLRTNVVETYHHLHSNICLVDEGTGEDNLYEARFSATHEYCTNECIEDSYGFGISIDKDSGEVTVIPK